MAGAPAGPLAPAQPVPHHAERRAVGGGCGRPGDSRPAWTRLVGAARRYGGGAHRPGDVAPDGPDPLANVVRARAGGSPPSGVVPLARAREPADGRSRRLDRLADPAAQTWLGEPLGR